VVLKIDTTFDSNKTSRADPYEQLRSELAINVDVACLFVYSLIACNLRVMLIVQLNTKRGA
jgi:hypothetical protein